MPGVSFLLPIWFDLAAVFLFALTGVWAATRRGYDVVGAFVLAFVTGVGGGLLRDAVFLQEIPAVMRDGRFLWVVLAAVVIGAAVQRLVRIEGGVQPARVEHDHRRPKSSSARSTSSAIDGPVERNSGSLGTGASASPASRDTASRSSSASLHRRCRASLVSARLSSGGRYTVVFVMPYIYHTF